MNETLKSYVFSDYSPFPVHHDACDTHEDQCSDSDEIEEAFSDDEDTHTLIEHSECESEPDRGVAVYESEVKRDCNNDGAKRYVSRVHIALHMPVPVLKSSSTSCVRYSRVRSPVRVNAPSLRLRAHSASPFAGKHSPLHHNSPTSPTSPKRPYDPIPFNYKSLCSCCQS